MNKHVEVKREVLRQLLVNILIDRNSSKRFAEEIANDISNIVTRKNHDYGDAWQRYGVFTPLIRINDKILRIETLAGGKEALVVEENIADTLKDIIGYAALALLWLQSSEKDYHEQLSFDDLINE